ncbi:hypothetical protein HYFRA_00003349 [Hymenoscyphus fraxineus]|uniref:ThuA-like domain-containing protein n=1 Tax=Hymenoscyphus fraxineus TaxID=746836 RepID=A0A9N9PRJ1_9HELO|nr:hypothetical protein HYFRA_00003349 [Hymenoscyphus fraxineus]
MRSAFTLPAMAALASSLAQAIQPNLLIFTKSTGWRHLSIPHGINLISSIADAKQWNVTATEDSSIFTKEGLSPFTTLVFISTTGDFLNTSESDALHEYLQNGGSWLGIHAAGDFGNGMPDWYNTLVGGQFASHPCYIEEICSPAQVASYPPDGTIRLDTVNITDATHPSTRGLPSSQLRADEWYSYKTNPTQDATYHVLAEINEDYVDANSPALLRMTPEHPISWYSMFEGKSRAWYTGMGHTNESYTEDYFVKHVTGGLMWVTGLEN